MFVNVGRLVAALALACSGLVLTQLPAHACTCQTLSTQAATKAATGVFTGTVTDTSTERAPGMRQRGRITTYDVAVERVYKGEVRTATLQVTSTQDLGCGPGPLADDKAYVFFTRDSGEELRVTPCSGTAPATTELVGKVEKLLGEGRKPVPDEPESAVFTPVSDAAPAPLTRLVAPGLALSLAGLLGLGLVRRLGRNG